MDIHKLKHSHPPSPFDGGRFKNSGLDVLPAQGTDLINEHLVEHWQGLQSVTD